MPTEIKNITTQEQMQFINDIKELVYRHQYEAMKQVNEHLIALYWEIGEEVTKRQDEQGWGKSIVEVLAQELQREFPNNRGLSARNIWTMRNFYLEFSKNEKLRPLVAEISWTKITKIMEKCKDDFEREFYIRMTKKYGWTKDVLINHIENKSYEKYMLNQTNFDKALPNKYRHQAKLAVKDDYNFDFLEMGGNHSERELELGLVNNIREFLAEMGGSFTFLGNQFPIKVGEKDFYIDLLLFHRKLRSLVAIELKIGDFKPEYVGKMEFYLTALDENVKEESENPPIGIIVCKNKDRTVVEYTLKTATQPIGIATYSLYDEIPEDIRKLLPSPTELAKRLEIL